MRDPIDHHLCAVSSVDHLESVTIDTENLSIVMVEKLGVRMTEVLRHLISVSVIYSVNSYG